MRKEKVYFGEVEIKLKYEGIENYLLKVTSTDEKYMSQENTIILPIFSYNQIVEI